MSRHLRTVSHVFFGLSVGACATTKSNPTHVGRDDFNKIAQELHLPLFWMGDANQNGSLDADELAVLWGFSDAKWSEYVLNGKLTPAFEKAMDQVREVSIHGHSPAGVDQRRVELVRKELAQGRPTLLLSKFESPADREVVRHLVSAAKTIEELYALQTGASALAPKLAGLDPSSQTLFFRNQGPWCEAPLTEGEPECTAIAPKPKKVSGLYPAEAQSEPGFCDKISNTPELADHFSGVVEKDGKLIPVPYPKLFPEQCARVAGALKAAALALPSDEGAFKTYLEAAANAFSTNDWAAADEAWARMSVKNSRWYLRIGPDETYFEPCNQKAGFHMSFARINPGSVAWQTKLDPLKGEMEKSLALLAGPPYSERKVEFQLPDFIDIVLNAGDSRSAIGATIGQSLPNWGPVANEGRGRTVAMTNLDSDPDNVRSARETAASLLCPATMTAYTDDPSALLLSTLLHEAAHNLGPAHEYRVGGKTDEEAFGGPLASTFEELKAQSAALYFADWLVEKNQLTRASADQTHLKDLTWIFGQISRGMTSAEGQPKPYSQLSAVQLGRMLDGGALQFDKSKTAANGSDVGCFELDFPKLPGVITAMMKDVAEIKAQGDRPRAEALVAKYVTGPTAALFPVISERVLRAPRSAFVYAIDVGD